MGHYSQGVLAHGILSVSGQLPLDPEDHSSPEGVEAQARQVSRNVIAIVEEVGGIQESIVQMQIFTPDISRRSAAHPGSEPLRDVPTRS
jgi:2-iminobutanoate/2-iminopropanoate deaminase